MPETHFNLYLYFACELFNKHNQIIQISKQIVGSRYIHINNIDKAIFPHDIAYNAYKNLEQFQIKYYVIKQLKLIVIQNMMNIKEELFEWL